jgi:hypothetical protein
VAHGFVVKSAGKRASTHLIHWNRWEWLDFLCYHDCNTKNETNLPGAISDRTFSDEMDDISNQSFPCQRLASVLITTIFAPNCSLRDGWNDREVTGFDRFDPRSQLKREHQPHLLEEVERTTTSKTVLK